MATRNSSVRTSFRSKTGYEGPGSSQDQSANVGLDEDVFTKSFEDVPRISIFSAKDVNDRLTKIREILADTSQDWEKRGNALKDIRSLLIAGATDLVGDFVVQQLKPLEVGLQTSIKDLRSQVVREACITVAYLAVQLETKFEHCAESLMPGLVALIQNSAKIMSSSATVAIRFIIKYTPSQRLVPTITCNLTSKSVAIRRQCYEFVQLIVESWPKQVLERHTATIQESIKRGLGDADLDARVFSRRAFSAFSEQFREQGFSILNSFEVAKQRQILAELDNPSLFDNMKVAATRSRSSDRSTGVTSSGYGMQPRQRHPTDGEGQRFDAPDIIPVVRPSGTASLRRNNSLRLTEPTGFISGFKKPLTVQYPTTPRNRPVPSKAGVSQSQPTSRSGSPTNSTRIPYLSSVQPDVAASSTPRSTMTASRVRVKRYTAQSQGCSRETSPDRRQDQEFKASVENARHAASVSSSPAPMRKAPLTAARLGEFGKDLEAAVTDVWRQRSARRRQSDDASSDAGSETSDGQGSDNSFRFNGSDMSEDVADIITMLLSGSWADRREGLIGLQRLFQADRRLSFVELKKVSEIFTRMFHDPHSKVFAVFIDTFIVFVNAHGCDLVEWFPVCFHRLLNKAGADVLGSLQTKIAKALDALRDSFPHSRQFSCITRFVVEQSQIPNVKVKLALLNYMLGLISLMEPSCFTNTSDTRLSISRIITWTSEPKSAEVRKAAQSVLLALLSLNAAELNLMISVLPKSFQDGAAKVLSAGQPGAQRSRIEQQPRGGRSLSLTMSSNGSDGFDSSDSGRFNREDLYNNIKKTTEDIQHLTLLGGQLDFTRNNGFSTASGNGSDTSDDAAPVDDESIEEILIELSNHDGRIEERRQAMNRLMNLTRKCADDDIWNKHFKMILLLVLETMKDTDGRMRAQSLRLLKEILEHQSSRFRLYAELTVLKLLEFEKDADKEVIRAAEECGNTLARVIPPEQSISILNPISLTAEFPINLAAIKMETKVVESATEQDVRSLMALMTPGLVKGFEHNESSVRKSSMLCLMALHRWVGNDLMPFLSDLNASKMKLLNLYIKRSCDTKEGVDASSPA